MKRFFFSLLFILLATFLISQSNFVFSQTPTPTPDGAQCKAQGWTCEANCTGNPKGPQDCPKIFGGIGTGWVQGICCDLSAPSPTPPTGAQCRAQGWTCVPSCSGAPKGDQDCPKIIGLGGPIQQVCCDTTAPSPTPLTGGQCVALGGTCVPSCSGDSKGEQDCPEIIGLGGRIKQVCCIIPPPANPFGTQIPGVGCGLPDDTAGADKCCQPVKLDCSMGVLDILQIIPGIGSLIGSAKAQCESLAKFQEKYANVKCLYGTERYDASGNCTCTLSEAGAPVPDVRILCEKYLTANVKELEACKKCASSGFYSGIGCVPFTLEGFVGYIFAFGIGLGGIIALLCIIYSAFIMQTSSGNPERLKKAQENLTSCIMGLMLIIFSVFILRLIGVDILRIPGLK